MRSSHGGASIPTSNNCLPASHCCLQMLARLVTTLPRSGCQERGDANGWCGDNPPNWSSKLVHSPWNCSAIPTLQWRTEIRHFPRSIRNVGFQQTAESKNASNRSVGRTRSLTAHKDLCNPREQQRHERIALLTTFPV